MWTSLLVFMHCEGCARKVKRCLRDACLHYVVAGVEDVKTDYRTHKMVVKGKKAAENPMKVVEWIQKKTGRKVELLTPLPPSKTKKKEEDKKEEENLKEDEKKEVIVPKDSSFLLDIDQRFKLFLSADHCAESNRGAGGGTEFEGHSEGYLRTAEAGGVRLQEVRQARGGDEVEDAKDGRVGGSGGGDAAKDKKKADAEAGGGNADNDKKEKKGDEEKEKKEAGGGGGDTMDK
ncbi:heavy metal-associated isoprenylated plant protein 3-like [Canna indica]|uniref:Heavy metal-associated isoprenylated plant protein 3-like n=1 Tax=Canna indica TaxID=4628 RepID=A0AAQ3QJT6_9LILI|nr:heavy metal-associated isoprenylated plant protein 3-like [Canna indica]